MDPLKSIGSLDPARRALSLLEEFKNFALKGNVIDLAVGVIIGAAFGKIVDSLVKHILMPLVGLLLPGEQGYLGWKIAVGAKELPYGLFLGELVNFIMMLFLPIDTWLRLVGWLAVGLVIYFSYGLWNSTLGKSMRGLTVPPVKVPAEIKV